MLVRKKPVVQEAWRLTQENKDRVFRTLSAIKHNVFPMGTDLNPALIIPTLVGDSIACVGDYIIKDANGELSVCKPDFFEKSYEAIDRAEDSAEPPVEYPKNRLLNAFPRDGALNEIYSTGEVDHRGVPVNYSIWRGDHSIMGMTGILFEKGFLAEDDYQEGVEDTDLLEMVHDRLVQLQDYVENGEWIVQAIISIEAAIKSLIEYQSFCSDIGDSGVC